MELQTSKAYGDAFINFHSNYSPSKGLITVGNFKIDTRCFIKAESYKVTYLVQDVNSYRDASGLLHRNAVDHCSVKVEFETPAMLTAKEVAFLYSNIRANYTVPKERKCNVTMYIPELDAYRTHACYMVDPPPQMYGNYHKNIHYNSFRICFIGY